MKKKLLIILALIVTLASLTACGGNASDGNINPNTFFSEFTAPALDGNEYTQTLFEENKITMVNIWGTFCSPCINEMPELEKLSKNYAEKGLVVVGIVSDTYDYLKKENNDRQIQIANEIIEMTGVTYINLLPSDSLNKAKLNYVHTFPTTYFLDEKGELIGECTGARTYEQWSMIVDSILETL